eukprot:CAMPEP_0183421970 /NCGR_PEP_ID=MMETSP0370-20130417/27478_1 /TAXON_ID=268820 /ORGANISM="Peridinium aciculiferum, Strain PAER-2" /LENGTH=49 /DNA_ID= /DNA_START= /DNA_END= /DNA_ORIENTATION=
MSLGLKGATPALATDGALVAAIHSRARAKALKEEPSTGVPSNTEHRVLE